MASPRFAASIVILALAATACSTADPGTLRGAIEEKKVEGRTRAITPPPQPDVARVGRVGLHLATNSRGWREALETPAVDGAVILLVVPGSPAEEAGFERGDVITRIGGTAIRNDERALVGLRGRPGDPIKVTVRRGGATVQLEVTPVRSIDADFATLVEDLVERSPGDPTYLLLRGQAAETIEEALVYVDRAIIVEPEFVDAFVYRARLFWAESLQASDEAVVEQDRGRASDDYRRALEIDPKATRALRSRGTGSLEIAAFDEAERDGLRAVGIDPTLPGAYYLVAAGRYGAGRAPEAVAPAREAVRLDPYNAAAYRLLALSFLALGRRADASETVEVGLTVATDENERAALRAVLDG